MKQRIIWIAPTYSRGDYHFRSRVPVEPIRPADLPGFVVVRAGEKTIVVAKNELSIES